MQFTRDVCQGGVMHVCIVRSVGRDWKFAVQPQSWWHCWQNIFFGLDRNSWHTHFLRDFAFLRDFSDGHNLWDCTTNRRLYVRTVLRSRKVSPMFAGRKNLIRPVGSLDMVPSPIFVIIFWESLSKNGDENGAGNHVQTADRSDQTISASKHRWYLPRT